MMPQQPQEIQLGTTGMETFPRHHLTKDETVIYESRPNLLPFIFHGIAIVLVVALIGGLNLFRVPALISVCFPLYIVGVLCSTVVILFSYLRWKNTYYAATSKRIMIQTGVFGKDLIDCPYDKIQNVTVLQPFHERIFGYGTLMFSTAGFAGGGGTSQGHLVLGGMAAGGVIWGGLTNPMEVRKRIQEIIDESIRRIKQQDYVQMAQAMAQAQKMAQPAYGTQPAYGYDAPAPDYQPPPQGAPCRWCGNPVPPTSAVCPKCGANQ